MAGSKKGSYQAVRLTFTGNGALVAYETLMARFAEVPRAQVIELYLRCVQALASAPEEEEIT